VVSPSAVSGASTISRPMVGVSSFMSADPPIIISIISPNTIIPIITPRIISPVFPFSILITSEVVMFLFYLHFFFLVIFCVFKILLVGKFY